jgi:hypothetical protein
VLVSLAAVAAFAIIGLPAIYACAGGLAGVAKYWLMPWLGYHFWMSTFTVVHHTAPHIPFKPAEEWNAAKAQLSGAWRRCARARWLAGRARARVVRWQRSVLLRAHGGTCAVCGCVRVAPHRERAYLRADSTLGAHTARARTHTHSTRAHTHTHACAQARWTASTRAGLSFCATTSACTCRTT